MPMSDRDIKAALDDLQALTLTLDAEGRGDPVESRIAIGSVIRTRLQMTRWGLTYRAVCLMPMQFSCWNDYAVDDNHRRTMMLAEAMVTGTPLRLTRAESDNLHETTFIAEGVMSGHLLDRVRGADHYLTTALFEQIQTRHGKHWAKGRTPVAVVGGHTFLRLG